MLIEVKSTKKEVFNVSYSKRDRDQFDILNNLAKEKFNVYYYVRWKGKRQHKWTKIKLPLDSYPVIKYK